MQPIKIPRHADIPHMLLFVSADELIPIAVMMGVGIFVGFLPLWMAAGVALTLVFRRFRNSKPDGYLLFALYRTGLLPLGARSAINPYHKKILP